MATIIGIDLGMFKGVACTDDPETREASYARSPPGCRPPSVVCEPMP